MTGVKTTGAVNGDDPKALEKGRLKKIFVDELESLRRETKDIVSKFKVETPEKLLISSWDKDFTYEKDRDIYQNELSELENRLFGLGGQSDFPQHEINQALSQLRILREKGNTAYNKAMEREKDLRGAQG